MKVLVERVYIVRACMNVSRHECSCTCRCSYGHLCWMPHVSDTGGLHDVHQNVIITLL